MNFIAYDTETELIPDRRTLRMGTRKIKLEPFVPPRLVCVSECGPHGTRLYGRDHGVGAVEASLESESTHLVFHNAAFDIAVLQHAGVAEWRIKKAVKENRIHDTMYMDMLVGLAKGRYDTPLPPDFKLVKMEKRSLDVLAAEYCRLTLDKDPSVRLAYGQYLGMDPEDMPAAFQQYAKKDAEATYRVWHSMIEGVDLSHLYSEPLQTATALALAELDQTGTRVDTAEALRLLPMFEKDMPELEAALIEAGLAREGVSDIVTDKMESLDEAADTFGEWVIDTAADAPSIWHPYTGHERWDRCRVRVFKTKKRVEVSFGNRSFHLNFNAIRERLEQVAKQCKLRPPKTDKGYLSMEADWWEDRLPADADDLRTWQKRQKLEKILNTYLRLYSQVDRVFANWNVLGARSGRMSCASPNIQNIPKRKHGIRSVFVPDEGKVFVIADYCAQEMYTLAEVMSQMGIEGPLLEGFQAGRDPHVTTTIRTIGEQPEQCQTILFALLAGYLRADISAPLDAGSIREALQLSGTVSCLSADKLSALTGLHLEFGSEPFLKECASVIAATIRAASTQTTSSLAPALTTAMTVLERGGTLLDVGTEAGRGVYRSICDLINAHGVRADGTPLAVTKKQRQGSKALNFGYPGGLGPASFREYAKATYGVEMTLEEAKEQKRRFFRAYPDIAEYIRRMQTDLDAGLIRHSQRGCAQWAQIMGLEWPCSRLDLKRAMLDHESRGIRQVIHNAERSLVVSLPSGRVRKGCVFTEGANTGFQGFASDVSKLGVVKCWLAGLEVKLVVHDEIGVQCDPAEVEETARLLEKCMLDSFIELCPRSGPYAKVEVEAPLERWGAATDKEGQKV